MTLTTLNRISRTLFLAGILMAAFLTFQGQAHAATCKVRLPELDMTIIGKGRTNDLAFEDAASKCFDKKAGKTRGPSHSDSGLVEEELGLAIIDQCANIRCEG